MSKNFLIGRLCACRRKMKVKNPNFQRLPIYQSPHRHRIMSIKTAEVSTCFECGKLFNEKSRFNKHFRQYHKKQESNCLLCEKTFTTAYLLKNHIGQFHRNVKCDICDSTFVKAVLKRHIKTHQDIQLPCEACGTVFNRKDNLNKHMKLCGTNMTRVRAAPTGEFKCDTCEKVLTNKTNLKQHKRTHARKLRQFDCKFCEKVFTSNQSLGKHVQNVHPNPRRVELQTWDSL